MKQDNPETNDDLRPEYDLQQLQVRKLGPQRAQFGNATVQLAPDVVDIFPNAEAVNEALRLLIRIMRDNQTHITDNTKRHKLG
jgi:hypothetical protein